VSKFIDQQVHKNNFILPFGF